MRDTLASALTWHTGDKRLVLLRLLQVRRASGRAGPGRRCCEASSPLRRPAGAAATACMATDAIPKLGQLKQAPSCTPLHCRADAVTGLLCPCLFAACGLFTTLPIHAVRDCLFH